MKRNTFLLKQKQASKQSCRIRTENYDPPQFNMETVSHLTW